MAARTGKQIIKELSGVSSKLAKKEAECDALRTQRNKLILEGRTGAVDGPVKLKDLSEASNLGTTFIGRIEAGDGNPEKGRKPSERSHPAPRSTKGKGTGRSAAKK